ncbi:MAG: HU family DNA-binding protein [Nitrospirae bacterium]|nr:HU family DNA-binding protein [Nitrospirota bacterium]
MNKSELINEISTSANITKAEAGKALDVMIDSIIKATKDGQKVTLIGFGTFSVSDRAAREGRNPSTGAKIKIPASKSPKFTAGKAFKDAVNKKKAKAEPKKAVPKSKR